jgi:hypothetical protein
MGRQLFQDGPFIDPPVTSPGGVHDDDDRAALAGGSVDAHLRERSEGGKNLLRARGRHHHDERQHGVAPHHAQVRHGWRRARRWPGAAPARDDEYPLVLQAELVFRTIGAAGTNSTAVLSGIMSIQGTLATAGSGTNIMFGSTASVSIDATINANIEINTTLGGTTGSPSIQTLWAYLFSRN